MRLILAFIACVGLSAASAGAQAPAAPLTNADVIRLLAAHTTDQKIVAAIIDATATQFDMSEKGVSELAAGGASFGVIGAMRRASKATTSSTAAPSSAAEGTTSLAAASAEAKKVEHSWDLSTNLGTPIAPAPSSAIDSTSASTSTTPEAKTERPSAVEVVKDEAWWRKRMTGLRAQLAEAKSTREAKQALVARLTAVRDNVPDRGFSVAQAYAAASAELAKARTDLETAITAESAAQTAIKNAEEEARTQGALPGWLR